VTQLNNAEDLGHEVANSPKTVPADRDCFGYIPNKKVSQARALSYGILQIDSHKKEDGII
jgi:hypothetical protein